MCCRVEFILSADVHTRGMESYCCLFSYLSMHDTLTVCVEDGMFNSGGGFGVARKASSAMLASPRNGYEELRQYGLAVSAVIVKRVTWTR